jgi:hypothetical protein
MLVSQVLNEAADDIQRDGWWSDYHGDDGQCAANAISKACDRFDLGIRRACQAALIAHLGGTALPDIWRWNDHPDRTAAEVIEVLRACAVIEQAREEQDAAWATYAGLVTA